MFPASLARIQPGNQAALPTRRRNAQHSTPVPSSPRVGGGLVGCGPARGAARPGGGIPSRTCAGARHSPHHIWCVKPRQEGHSPETTPAAGGAEGLELAGERVVDEAGEAGVGHDGLQGGGAGEELVDRGGELGARDHPDHGAAVGGEAQAARLGADGLAVAGDQRVEVVEAQVALETGVGGRDGLEGEAVGLGDAAGEAMSAASWRPEYTFMVVPIQGTTTGISRRRVSVSSWLGGTGLLLFQLLHLEHDECFVDALQQGVGEAGAAVEEAAFEHVEENELDQGPGGEAVEELLLVEAAAIEVSLKKGGAEAEGLLAGAILEDLLGLEAAVTVVASDPVTKPL